MCIKNGHVRSSGWRHKLEATVSILAKHPHTKPSRRRGCIFVALLSLSACGSDRPIEWKEQVRLQSGEMIVVARTALFSENFIAGGGGGSFNKGMTLKIDQPAGGDNPALWDARYVPIVLDRDPETREWFIVATFFHCDGWYDLGRPKLPYTEYRYRSGRWIQVPLTIKWIGREADLLSVDLAERKGIEESKPILTVERKEQLIARRPTAAPIYRKIVEEWTTGC